MNLDIRFGNRTDQFSLTWGKDWEGKFYLFFGHNTVWKNGSFRLRVVVPLIGE
jgi:hypothetical protein